MLTLALIALAPLQGTGGIMDKLQFDAEGRLRGEATWNNVDATTGNDIADRYRGRMRLRFGAKYQMMDEVLVGARLSTASDGNDANNPHWDFGDGDGFNSSQVVLDRFYFDWTAAKELHVVAGKQPQAFQTPPIFGDFVWDSDISPSGLSATLKPETPGDIDYDVRIAGYVATEVAADEDPKMWGLQGNASMPLDQAKLKGSAAIYFWGDNHDTAVAGNQGNSDVTEYFTILDTFVSGTMPGGPLEEMTGYVEFIKNLEESDAGFVIGAQLGSSTWSRGHYNTFLLLYTLDGDAIFSPVAQDDTPIAGSGLNDGNGDGMSGIIVGGQYFMRDNVAVKLWVLTSDPDNADSDPFRLRLDLDFRVK
jgi:hypothetical protein